MKLLMLTPRFPYPPTRGDSLRAWGELRYLAARHDVWLACVEQTLPRSEHVEHVRHVCRDVALAVRGRVRALLGGGLSLARGGSLTEGYFFDRRLADVIGDWHAAVRFDAVLTFSSATARYAELVAAPRRALDLNDVDSAKWAAYSRKSWPPLKWVHALEAHRLARAEARWATEHDACVVVNRRERRKFVDLIAGQRRPEGDVGQGARDPRNARNAGAGCGAACAFASGGCAIGPCAGTTGGAFGIQVIPTGVDVSRYHIDSVCNERDAALPPIVGTIGSLSYRPNVEAVEWFGTHVWPRVRAELPSARWLIVGRQPVRRVRRWARYPGVTLRADVADVRPLLQVMRVFVCTPQEEIGVQTKLIEALAEGRAGVITPQAAGGFDDLAPQPFIVAQTPADFAGAVLHLLTDDAAVRALGTRARAAAEACHSVEALGARIERCLCGTAPNVNEAAGGAQRANAPTQTTDFTRRTPRLLESVPM